jgi:hypothetical protein
MIWVGYISGRVNMTAEYQCDMCGHTMLNTADTFVRWGYDESYVDEFHFCETCTEEYLEPVLEKAILAVEKRNEAGARNPKREKRLLHGRKKNRPPMV